MIYQNVFFELSGVPKADTPTHGMQQGDGHCSDRICKPRERNHVEKPYPINYKLIQLCQLQTP